MRYHALIIDDNEQNVNVLAQLLNRENVTSTKITDPEQIENALENLTDFSVVFLDLEMPGLNGYQVLERFKTDVRYASVPVVAYTVHVNHMAEAIERGFDGFLGKPLNATRFPDQIARILRGESVWETL